MTLDGLRTTASTSAPALKRRVGYEENEEGAMAGQLKRLRMSDQEEMDITEQEI